MFHDVMSTSGFGKQFTKFTQRENVHGFHQLIDVAVYLTYQRATSVWTTRVFWKWGFHTITVWWGHTPGHNTEVAIISFY